MSDLVRQFRSNLRYLRETKGLSQERLAELVGLSLTSIAHFESGRKKPSFETLELLGDALGVHPYRLFIPAIPVDDELIDRATSELRDVVRKMFFTVEALSQDQ